MLGIKKFQARLLEVLKHFYYSVLTEVGLVIRMYPIIRHCFQLLRAWLSFNNLLKLSDSDFFFFPNSKAYLTTV